MGILSTEMLCYSFGDSKVAVLSMTVNLERKFRLSRRLVRGQRPGAVGRMVSEATADVPKDSEGRSVAMGGPV